MSDPMHAPPGEAPPDDPPSWRRRLAGGAARAAGTVVGTLGFGALLVAAVLGPVLRKIDTQILGYYSDDQAGGLYLHGRIHELVQAGRLPMWDDSEFHPVGSALWASDGGNYLEIYLTFLLRQFLPWPTWYALGQVAWIPLNLLAFVPLGRYLFGTTARALAVGSAWVIMPYYLGEIAGGRMTQSVVAGVPLAVLGLLKVAEGTPTRGDTWLAGAGLALTGIGYWFFGVFLGLCVPFFALHGLSRRPWRPLAWDFARVGLVALGLALPFALPMLLPRFTGAWGPVPPLDPATLPPVFDNALQLQGPQPLQLRGWFPWVFAPGLLWTLWEGPRRWLWLGAAAFCLVCGLGPGQEIDDRVYLLPYQVLWRTVPYLGRLTHPGRWVGVAALFLGLAAAAGLARRLPRALWLLPVGVYAQLWLAGNLPLATMDVRVPGPWRHLAREGGGAVIVVPVLQSALTCRFHPFHRRALLGGRAEQIPWAWPPEFRRFMEENSLLMHLYALGRGVDRAPAVYQQDLDALREARFTTVLLDGDSWRRMRTPLPDLAVEERLTEAFGAPLFRDGDGAVWALPESGLPGTPPPAPVTLPLP